MNRRKEVSLKDIADRLGLTVHTVSKALRGRPGMSEGTRRLVFRTAGELGYRTKAQELTLVVDRVAALSGKQRRFVLVAETEGGVAGLLAEGIRERLEELGHRLDVCLCGARTKHPYALRDWLESTGVPYASGIFVAPIGSPGVERALLSLPPPKIIVNYPEAGVEADSVVWDVYDAMTRSVNALAAAGHTRMIYVGQIEARRGFRLRWQAFSEALADNGIRLDPTECVLEPTPTREQWIRSFAEAWERLRPTAVVCAVEYMLPWVVQACRILRIAVPDEASIVGLDTLAGAGLPELTGPELPVHDTGVRAADRMLWRIANPHLPYEHSRLLCRWRQGGTVKKIHELQITK